MASQAHAAGQLPIPLLINAPTQDRDGSPGRRSGMIKPLAAARHRPGAGVGALEVRDCAAPRVGAEDRGDLVSVAARTAGGPQRPAALGRVAGRHGPGRAPALRAGRDKLRWALRGLGAVLVAGPAARPHPGCTLAPLSAGPPGVSIPDPRGQRVWYNAEAPVRTFR